MLRLGDILTAYTTAQSDKDKVAKLSYVVRKEKFQVLRTTGRGSYYIHNLHKSDSSKSFHNH